MKLTDFHSYVLYPPVFCTQPGDVFKCHYHSGYLPAFVLAVGFGFGGFALSKTSRN